MALVDQEIQLIELVTHVAQQVQRGKDASAYLAYLNRIFQGEKTQTVLLNALITSLDVPQLRRLLREDALTALPLLHLSFQERGLSSTKLRYPEKTQTRIATDSLIARYLGWLARDPHHRAVACHRY